MTSAPKGHRAATRRCTRSSLCEKFAKPHRWYARASDRELANDCDVKPSEKRGARWGEAALEARQDGPESGDAHRRGGGRDDANSPPCLESRVGREKARDAPWHIEPRVHGALARARGDEPGRTEALRETA